MPSRQPDGTLPARQYGGSHTAQGDLPGRSGEYAGGRPGRSGRPGQGGDPFGQGGEPRRQGGGEPVRQGSEPVRQGGAQGGEMPVYPRRQPMARPPRPAGRHRRAVPATLPDTAPALVLAVPGDTDLTSSPVGDLSAVLRVDNPAVDVRVARIDEAGPNDPAGIRAILTEAAEHRPEGPASAIVIPLTASPHPAINRKVREAVAAAGTNAVISGFINSNALIAEALHIRLAEAGLARADRVRLFSIVTAADGIIIATVGGPEAAMSANVTSVLLAARLALPVITASMDSQPTVQEAAMRLKEMGASRLAIAPCIIGPEASRSDIDSLAVGAECAAPIGAHGNIAKLAANTYGMAISSMQFPGEQQLKED
ncbi:MAG: sirohydrochlorin chelatase [Trebonia sp.]